MIIISKERVKAINNNTKALNKATFGMARWEKKDDKHHGRHEQILKGMSKKLDQIIVLLKPQKK